MIKLTVHFELMNILKWSFCVQEPWDSILSTHKINEYNVELIKTKKGTFKNVQQSPLIHGGHIPTPSVDA